jgi:PPOX class probable F420-dependent enzyme
MIHHPERLEARRFGRDGQRRDTFEHRVIRDPGEREARYLQPEARHGAILRRDTVDAGGAGMDRGEALNRLRSARVGRMATVTPEHRPHVVPFVFAVVEHGPALVAYWAVDRKPKRTSDIKRLRNIEANPAVEFVVDGYAEEWEGLWWVRCAGTARVVTDEAERGDALRELGDKYPQYRDDPPEGPVVAIEIEAVHGWAAAEAPLV